MLAGLVIGFVNVSSKEVQPFMLAAIAVLVANTANLGSLIPGVLQIGTILAGIVAKVLVVVAPAALVVGLKAIYKTVV